MVRTQVLSSPRPVTSCRRFDEVSARQLINAVNEVLLNVWQQQADGCFDEAVVEIDGTIVSTTVEGKVAMVIIFKGERGRRRRIQSGDAAIRCLASPANTTEPLLIVNRSGNRPSEEDAGKEANHLIPFL